MKILHAILFFTIFVTCNTPSYATEHHGGHSGGKNRGNSNNCLRPRLEKFLPPHLATVAPGSEFSFVVFNLESPEHLMVTAKNEPVTLTTEFKNPFYIVKGKLPDNLRNTMARINIKIHSKTSSCEAENGWLVKITE